MTATYAYDDEDWRTMKTGGRGGLGGLVQEARKDNR